MTLNDLDMSMGQSAHMHTTNNSEAQTRSLISSFWVPAQF